MAQRRMFSNRIANSARFLQMPAESQLLYFHLVLRADDDGIVESYPIMKLLGLAPDNFRVLLAKDFIRQLNEEQVVVVMDWQEHNNIRADRKVNSIYLPLLREKCPEIPILQPKPRKDVEDNSRRLGDGQSTDGIGEDRLGEYSIGEKRREEDNFFLSSKKKKKPFFKNQEMRWSQKKWWVLPEDGGKWLEFAGLEEDIEWR